MADLAASLYTGENSDLKNEDVAVGEEEKQYRSSFVLFREFYLGHDVENNKTG